MKVIITNLDQSDHSISSELTDIDNFEFNSEVEISTSTYKELFDISFVNEVGMNQNKYNIVVISMEKSKEELERDTELKQSSSEYDELANIIMSRINLYDGIYAGVKSIHPSGDNTSNCNASIAIFNSIV
ncbi:MAG: hypothetical protein L3I99_05590 [Sulfurimonas sp.]|nr:hypothetical protein [Sulfurimonas sp.]